MRLLSLTPYLAALILAPLLFGVINRTKAFYAGRVGRPLLQMYYDLRKLWAKQSVYSRSTSWVFQAGPVLNLSTVLAAFALMPWPGFSALISFEGDAVVFVYLLALGRMALALSALDTGSAFEGMGASRDMSFAALAEPVLLLFLLILGRHADSLSLSMMFAPGHSLAWTTSAPVLLLAALGLFVVLLLENCRIPFDDPNTHLELTMIHEVMALDHSGPDLGLIEYASTLKYWVLGTLLLNVLLPGATGTAMAAALAMLFGIAIATGIVESGMARLRLTTVPRLIAMSTGCAVVALVLAWR